MNWRIGFLALAIFASLVLVITDQSATIDQQRTMIRSFYNDPGCMHDPRVKPKH